MARYEDDYDLEFLGKCSDEELELLFNLLVYDKDGKKRYAEELTKSSKYKMYGNNYSKYWKDIAGELQHYGGNSIANKVRGYGVEYEEILDDVIEALKLDEDDDLITIDEKENVLLEYAFSSIVAEMSEMEKLTLLKEMDCKEISNLSKGAMLMVMQGVIKTGGVALTRLLTYIANYVVRGVVGKVAIGGASRAIGAFTGPIGLAITGVWTLADITSPAMRVTIPASIVVASLRKIVMEREKREEVEKMYKFFECSECGSKLRAKKESKRVKCPNCEAVIIF